MSRYIEADTMIETIRNFVDTMSVCPSTDYCNGLRFMKKQAIEAAENAPTVEAVPVVRCKDCKHNKGKKVWRDGELTIDCDNDMGYTPPDFFCADGERRS